MNKRAKIAATKNARSATRCTAAPDGGAQRHNSPLTCE
jgi:hypothetical protein